VHEETAVPVLVGPAQEAAGVVLDGLAGGVERAVCAEAADDVALADAGDEDVDAATAGGAGGDLGARGVLRSPAGRLFRPCV
jgi:hypothetical protein